jgi:light-regulated signal transduction histidine kinase (bacteriophytochrome)
MAGVLINITEHKTTEEKLKQLAEKLSQSNKELEQFAYVASHDLQEPLRMVASYIQLLQRRYKGKLSGEADEFINYAVDGVIRMKTLINDLLVYSRVNTKESPLEDVDINKVVDQTRTNLHAAIEESGATINSEPLPVVKANNLQINQLFQNLISNAIKFRKPDTAPVVNISAKHAGDEWLFTVQDNGIGIDKEFSDKIFVIFQRLHNSSEYPGTGIGLAICKRIVEKLGGHLWVESNPGEGSTFNFTIPDRD